MTTNIRVVNRKGEELCQLKDVSIDMKVDDFRNLFLKECEYASKSDRLYTTLNVVTCSRKEKVKSSQTSIHRRRLA